jgi:hypothetical protein
MKVRQVSEIDKIYLWNLFAGTSVVDPHHVDADPDADSTYHPDADPDADPDSDFYFMRIFI